jgi:antitoxin FitA
MAQLIVRNIEAEIVRRLKLRAAEHGRSAEEEHREILRRALGALTHDRSDFKTLLASIPEGEDVFDRPSDTGRAVEL